MNPLSRDLYVDQLLTNIVIGYRNPVYIADELCPLVRVDVQSGLVPATLQSDWFRDAAQKRAPGTPSRGIGFGVTSSAYYAHRYSFRHEIDDDTKANAAAPWNLEQLSARFVTDKILMKREINAASSFFATTIWGDDETGAVDFTQWDDVGGSNPLVDIETYRNEIEMRVGFTPNTLVLGPDVWSLGLKFNPVLVDMVKYTQRSLLGPELVASLLEIDRLLIGRAIHTTSLLGTAEASVVYQRIWGKKALLAYVSRSPSVMEPSACYTLWWAREGAPAQPTYIKRMRNEESEVDIIESNSYFDKKVTSARSATFLDAVVV
jgi:hypothetical protein